MLYECVNAYYFGHINSIGGIESHLYYISKKFGDLDITVFYRTGDPIQIERLKKNVRCRALGANDKVKCKRLFCCFNREILDQCEADEKILVLHGDYKDMINRGQISQSALPIDKRIDKYIGVSQLVCDSWKEITGIEAENVYQPVELDKCEKPLLFCSATRLTVEKGWNRMVKLANALDENNVNYIWMVYTNAQPNTKNGPKPTKNMVFCEPRLDITDKLGIFDAYIQLSDNEGFCLSVVEALCRGVPVICTDLPVFKELGLNDSNSVKVDLNMEKIPVDKIRNIFQLRFNYKAPADKWDKYLIPEKTSYDPTRVYKVKALDTYKRYRITDAMLKHIPEPGEIFEITGDDRLEVLLGANMHKEVFVEVLE